MDGRRISTILLSVGVTVLVVALVWLPEVAFNGAQRGLELWWNIVFPALLPFFVGGQILMGLGVVHGLGVVLEPFMRPLFNLPGVGGFVTAMGLASGYPIGALLTARLRKDGEITAAEGERLMSFANTADPLFMAGAVAVAMFGQATVAGALMAAHYAGALVTGFAMRFHKPGAPTSPPLAPSQKSMLQRSWRALLDAREKDGRPFGQVFGDSVRDSVQTLLLVGGFIIIFAVIIELLAAAGIVDAAGRLASPLLQFFGLDAALAPGLMAGLFEITLGSQLSADAMAPLLERLIAASAVIGWAGLSVHAQVAALTQGTGMSVKPYLVARFIHAVAAGAVLPWFLRADIPVFGPLAVMATTASSGGEMEPLNWAGTVLYSTTSLVQVLACLLVAVILIGGWGWLRRLRWVGAGSERK